MRTVTELLNKRMHKMPDESTPTPTPQVAPVDQEMQDSLEKELEQFSPTLQPTLKNHVPQTSHPKPEGVPTNRDTYEGAKELRKKQLTEELTNYKAIAQTLEKEIEYREGELAEVTTVIKSTQAAIECLEEPNPPATAGLKKTKNGN